MHRFSNRQLFAAAVLIWGTTWFAITFQVASYPPEAGVALRFAVAGSVLAFACFLTLQERLGPGPTATIGVMTPLVALCVSLGFEDYRPGLLTLAGAMLAVLGNALKLRPRR